MQILNLSDCHFCPRFICLSTVLLGTNYLGHHFSKEEKLKRFPQEGNLADGQSLRSEGDNSKFLNDGRCHIFDKENVDLTLMLGFQFFFFFFEVRKIMTKVFCPQ
jgi:hypothetical protein